MRSSCKIRVLTAFAILLISAAVCGAYGTEADIDGVTPGSWTMDLDAARKAAAEKKIPIILNFSGSDWCGWCRLMEKSVFSKPGWKDYAKEHILMVLVDFPQDKSIVPQKYRKRNEELKHKYGIEGFPTFIILDADGETELGRLSAGQDKTSESFIGEISGLTRYTRGSVEKYMKSLKPEERESYAEIMKKMSDAKAGIKAQKEAIEAAQKKIEELAKKQAEAEEEAALFRAAQLGPDELEKYKKLKAEFDKTEKEMQTWFATGPQRNAENEKKYRNYMSIIAELKAKLTKY